MLTTLKLLFAFHRRNRWNLEFFCRYEGSLDPWSSTLWSSLYQRNPQLFPNGLDILSSDTNFLDQPKVKIIYHDNRDGNSESSTGTCVFFFFFSSILVKEIYNSTHNLCLQNNKEKAAEIEYKTFLF